MLSLNTNLAALSTQNSLSASQKALSTSMARLGTGYRVNSAMDDAAGLQIATRLNAQTRGMAVAQKNTQNGISMMQTAEGAFSEVTDILQRMKDLATEAYTASTTSTDQTAMQSEFDALGTELGNIVKNTSFGGKQLFSNGTTTDGSGGLLSTATLTFQIGASAGETMKVDTQTSLTAVATALDSASSNYATPGTAGTELTGGSNAIITTLSTALDAVGSFRSTLGAASNRLDHVYNNLANMSTNTSAAKGRIMDVDYATETSNMTSKQMLLQAGTSMLKQSNSMSQMVLSLMQ
ncbi:Lateral flagellin [Ideonella sp. B7]|uniref:flagellin N-terminal helical domain-containing protein n=1 Tax=Ideonella benzenivorans TaxID=2831643 RepID=UPI001CEC7F60|nr:flagellin [Ideonella benzenivorans]MCA6217196.1 Lateral flagellin [Ideonella benzenivorans]